MRHDQVDFNSKGGQSELNHRVGWLVVFVVALAVNALSFAV